MLIPLYLSNATYSQFPNSHKESSKPDKVAIINFDDGYKSQFTNAKPILDKYGFKAAFFIVCNFVGKDAKQMSLPNVVDFVGKGIDQMSWQDLKLLENEGHVIGAHTMNHIDLNTLSTRDLDYEIGKSKQCLISHGINTTIFAYPYNNGKDNATVVSTVAKYYEMARSGNEPLMFLHCDKRDEEHDNTDETNQADCNVFSENGTPNPMSKYSIVGWSHDYPRRKYSYDDSQMLQEFIKTVNSQLQYNKNGKITAIPIVVYHKIDDSKSDYSTSVSLFNQEMKYLHDNGFKVLNISDIAYDQNNKYLYVDN